MCSSRFLAAFSCGLALAVGSARVTAQDNTCSLPPAAPFNPYLLNYDRQHTYNPYSSKDNEVANVNHEPKAPGEKGHWISKSYKVGCGADSGLFKETYLSAAVGSQTEGGVCSGTYLHIANLSPKYPAYFGVDGLLNDHLEPKQRKVIHLPRYAPGTGAKPAVVANVYVKYWDDEGISSTAQIAGRCNTAKEYLEYLVHHGPPSDYLTVRKTFVWPSGTESFTGSWLTLAKFGHVYQGPGGYFTYFQNDTNQKLIIEKCFTLDGKFTCVIRDIGPGRSSNISNVLHDSSTFRVYAEPTTNFFSNPDELIFDPNNSGNWSYHKDKKSGTQQHHN